MPQPCKSSPNRASAVCLSVTVAKNTAAFSRKLCSPVLNKAAGVTALRFEPRSPQQYDWARIPNTCCHSFERQSEAKKKYDSSHLCLYIMRSFWNSWYNFLKINDTAILERARHKWLLFACWSQEVPLSLQLLSVRVFFCGAQQYISVKDDDIKVVPKRNI